MAELPLLPQSFFLRDTVTVAKALLGHQLWVRQPQNADESCFESYLKYTIVETEAYTQDDPACHAFGKTADKVTGRAAMLYKSPGLAYVYLIYGMYHCLNVITESEGVAGAVLFRGLAPLKSKFPQNTHGPGRLTKALDITKAHNGLSMIEQDAPLLLVQGQSLPAGKVRTTTRIGISKAVDYPWRFYVKDSPFVSVKLPCDRKIKSR